jgi:hypothetical protein
MAGGAAFAQDYGTNIVDDLEHGSNLNNWGGYWYIYATQDADIKNKGPADAYGEMSFKPTSGTGRPVGLGAPTIGAHVVIQTLGTVDAGKGPWTESYPEVAIATMLTKDTLKGMGADFAKDAKSVKFWAKASKPKTIIWAKVETIENFGNVSECYDMAAKDAWNTNGDPVDGTAATTNPDAKSWTAMGCNTMTGSSTPLKSSDFPNYFNSKDIRTYNAYGVEIEISDTWQEYTLLIKDVNATKKGGLVADYKAAGPTASTGTTNKETRTYGLTQQPWFGIEFDFKVANVTRLSWSVKKQDNTSHTEDDFITLDDITVDNFKFIAPDLCTGNCGGVPNPPKTGATLFSDFDTWDHVPDWVEYPGDRVNVLGGYWYHYDDSEAGGSAVIDGPFKTDYINSKGDRGDVIDTEGAGRGGTNGAYMTFSLGEPFQDERNPENYITSFVGLGANFFDAEDTDRPQAFDADAEGITGIYFEYKMDGDVPSIFVEVEDETSVAANNGEVYYIRVPVPVGSDGKPTSDWKGAWIYFDKLVLPDWADRTSALNLKKLKKVQFKVQGPSGMYGELGIDNVWLLTANAPVRQLGVKSVATAKGLRATYSRGNVGVKFGASAPIASGQIQLINTKGRVVAKAPIGRNMGSNITANLNAARLSTGMYFVRVNAKDINGRKVVQQTPVSIVK